MAVRIRLKQMGRRHRAFFRVCAMDSRTPRGGKVLEELGTYDPMVPETDARAILKAERIDYWLGVGAQPTEKVNALIRKYGTNGTHADRQKAAIERLAQPKSIPDPGAPASLPKKPEPTPEPEDKAPEGKAAAPAKDKAPAEPEAVASEVPAEAAAGKETAEAAAGKETTEAAAGKETTEAAAEAETSQAEAAPEKAVEGETKEEEG